ncbi:zinc carboxypeptidase A 1-like [Toxorhynchites rutilus septentrionalis]|uniref:zinc carboxypeptidase A 1-like n=1 Tax=Toxorhynchites rutilus septentrionalis TaxID=329112 RepID=UPI002478BC86|nr:zinc carboxypeptidase A 1-like [Toxorhynchites rutilus septentrionalis]
MQISKLFNTVSQPMGTAHCYIFLEKGLKVGDGSNIVVAPHKLADFTEMLEVEGIKAEILDTNLQRSIDQEKYRMKSKGAKRIFDWSEYHELEEIHSWLDKLALNYEQVEVVEGGHSYENRTIKGVKVSYKSGNPGIFLEGGIHAREWISPATVTYILNELLTSQDPKVRNISENYDWYIFPNVNPDGYVYTHKKNRLWRKTRTPYSGACFGADANRNWDFHWAEQGTSDRCNTETFGGPHAFSEVETKSLSQYIESLKGKIQAYIAFHSYSQVLLYPYGHTIEHTPNHDDLTDIANATVTALAKRYGTIYYYGNIYDIMYPTSGASIEWVYESLGVKIAYVYELRPSPSPWNSGFILPPEEIVPTGEETLDSLVTLVEESAKRKYFEL